MMRFCYVLPLALAVLTGCNTTPASTATTTADQPAATPTSGPETATQTPGEACNVQVAGLTFTRSLNGAAQNATVAQGKLTLRSEAKRDNFNDPDGKLSNNTAPVLLTEVNNRQPFTLTANVTPDFLDRYDAGVLYVYLNPKLWQKFCFERDELARTRIVSVRTIGTSDDNNHDVVKSPAVYLKISSDTRTVASYYSLDKKTWQLVRLYKNDYPATLWAGVSAQCPIDTGTTSHFEDISLTQNSVSDFRLGN